MTAPSYPFKICDPLHGFIRFDESEKRVIDSRPFQRLRYLHQMGVAYLIYPGATHTRFEHSLGVMELVSRMYDALQSRKNLPHEEAAYWRKILRIAALCHDLGHLPFSHTAEKALLPQGGHEKMTLALIGSEEMRAIWEEIPSEGRSVEEDIVALSLYEGAKNPVLRILSQLITEDNFGADRIDYLLRDAAYTGVGFGRFDYHQLIDQLRVLPHKGESALGVSESGLQSVEALWIARYLMYSRVYHHSKSRIFTFHMERFMSRMYGGELHQPALDWYLDQGDYTVLQHLHLAAQKKDFDALALLRGGKRYADLSSLVKEERVLEELKKIFDSTSLYSDKTPPP